MSSTTLKIIAAVMVSLAVIFALLLVGFYQRNETRAREAEARAQEQQQQATLAVVAVKPLAAYKPIARENVALVPLPVVPQQYFTTLEDVVGRIPLLDIDAGAPVTARYFKEGNALARVIPPGFQAVSVEINDVIAVGGFVRPGDIVDLLVYLRGGPGVSEPQARVLLKQVRVLAYEERIVDRPQGLVEEEKAGGNAQSRRVRTAVLAVPEDEATRVMLGASLGELRLALRSQDPVGRDHRRRRAAVAAGTGGARSTESAGSGADRLTAVAGAAVAG
jgi:pilus assembly protein CpaB